MDYKHEVIFCIVNAGYTDAVMEAARSFGARGGTVIHARGTANPQAESKFNITVQPEKEIVMILVEREVKDDILHALYKAIGLQTAGQGMPQKRKNSRKKKQKARKCPKTIKRRTKNERKNNL